MKKILILIALGFAVNSDAQNMRKGIELTAPAEKGTAGFSLTTGKDNILVGRRSGYNLNTGSYNLIIGDTAGHELTTGTENIFIGKYTGYNLISGHANSFLGAGAGQAFYNNSIGNTCVGHYSGYTAPNNTVGNQNTFIGNESGYSPSFTNVFNYNTFVGARSGYSFKGSKSTILGANTGLVSTSYFGDKLTLIGTDAKNGASAFLTNSTAIGADATVSKDNALVLGNNAYVGIGTSTPNNLLELKHLPTWGNYNLYSDSRSDNPGMNCNWDNAAFVVNGDYTKALVVFKSNNECNGPNHGPTQETFHVYGNGFVEAAAYGVGSDKRYKKDIKTIENSLDVVKKLDGVSYKFNFELATNPNADGKPSYGFIAQEVEKIIPDAVMKNKDGYYSVNYDAIIPFLNNAIKEQQKQIEAQNAKIEKLEAQIQNGSKATNLSVNDGSKLEGAYLAQNTPNPFSNNTEIKYQLPKGTQTAMLGIYDLNGKQVKMYPINTENNSGSITVQAQELQAGMYLYTLVVDGKAFDTKRMVLTAQ